MPAVHQRTAPQTTLAVDRQTEKRRRVTDAGIVCGPDVRYASLRPGGPTGTLGVNSPFELLFRE